MKEKTVKTLKRILAFMLALITTASLFRQSGFAEQGVSTICFIVEDEEVTARIVKVKDDYYINARDLAAMMNCSYYENDSSENVLIYIINENGTIILYQEPYSLTAVREGERYVPLQESTVAVGAEISVVDGQAYLYRHRTPLEFHMMLDSVFRDKYLGLHNLILDFGVHTWALATSVSKIYAIFAPTPIKGLVDTVSGKHELDLYQDALLSLMQDQSYMELIFSKAKEYKESGDKVLRFVEYMNKLGNMDSKLETALRDLGLSNEVIEELQSLRIREREWGLDAGIDFLEILLSGKKSLDYLQKYEFFDSLNIYLTICDTETSIYNAIIDSFRDSPNRAVRNATQLMIDAGEFNERFVLGTYGRVAYNAIFYHLAKTFEEKIFDLDLNQVFDKSGLPKIGSVMECLSSKNAIIGPMAKYILNRQELAGGFKAVEYITAYYVLQSDILRQYSYSIMHNDDTDMDRLRALAILYVKCAGLAYNTFAFDKSMAASVEIANDKVSEWMNKILSYTESDYSPKYTNASFVKLIDELINNGPGLGIEPEPATVDETINEDDSGYPAESELFDNTYWSVFFGFTDGSHYLGKFSLSDHSFIFVNIVGDVMKGQYEYVKENGKLTIRSESLREPIEFQYFYDHGPVYFTDTGERLGDWSSGEGFYSIETYMSMGAPGQFSFFLQQGSNDTSPSTGDYFEEWLYR